MKRYNTTAIVIKKRNYKDSDKFVTLFTKDLGKIMATARGVRKISSRRAGNLDTLNFVNIKISENIKGHKSIDEVVTKEGFFNIKDDFAKTQKAFYILELIDKALGEEDKNEELFNSLYRTLKLINASYTDLDTLVLHFEVNFLKHLGYKIPKEKLPSESIDELNKASPVIKSYIYEYVAEKLKSLEIF